MICLQMSRLSGILDSSIPGVSASLLETVQIPDLYNSNNRGWSRLPESRVLLRSGPGWYVGWAVCHGPVAQQLHQLYQRPAFIHPDSTPPSKPWIFIGTRQVLYHRNTVHQTSWFSGQILIGSTPFSSSYNAYLT